MIKQSTPLKLLVSLVFAFISHAIPAQDIQDAQKALSLIKNNAAAIGLTQQNIIDSRVSDTYIDALSGNTMVYLQQTYMGIDVDKVIQVLAFKNGKLVSGAGKRIDLSLVNNAALAQQKQALTPPVKAENAVQAAAQHLHLSTPSLSERPAASQDVSKSTDFGDLGIAKENVTARLLWIPQKSFQRVRLVWEVNLSPKKSRDSWRVMVDAAKGNVVKKENYTVYDNPATLKGGIAKKPALMFGQPAEKRSGYKEPTVEGITSVTYRVIPFPGRSSQLSRGYSSIGYQSVGFISRRQPGSSFYME